MRVGNQARTGMMAASMGQGTRSANVFCSSRRKTVANNAWKKCGCPQAHTIQNLVTSPGPVSCSSALSVYRRQRGWLAGVLMLQLVGGLGVLFAPGQEVFPLYSWFLFPLTPNPGVRAELRLLEYQGRAYAPPVSLESARDVVATTQAPVVVRLARDLARAIAQKNEPEANRIRQILEGNYMAGPGRYELVEIEYDPIQRLQTGAEQVRKVREFKIGVP